ncbi:MAG: aquaporin Z [Actinobacteria bacterium]|nr:aquaporin Z [Actinomycetota bacterium]
MKLPQRLAAEFAGTFVLVLGGCGSAVLAAKFLPPNEKTGIGFGIGFAGVSLAFGLTVVVMAYAVGHISGGHFNPAITLGLAAGRRFEWKDAIPYIVTQVIAAIAAAAVLWVIALGQEGQTADALRNGGFATNGYGIRSPGLYSASAGFIIEVVMTAIFLMVIMGATDTRAPKGFAPLAIGLSLTLIHLVSIPVTNTSVNPARSTGPALFVGGDAITQLWLFWTAPIIGGILGALIYRLMAGDHDTVETAQALEA